MREPHCAEKIGECRARNITRREQDDDIFELGDPWYLNALPIQVGQRTSQRSSLVRIIEDMAASYRFRVEARNAKNIIQPCVVGVHFYPKKRCLYRADATARQTG